jgi:hypothetical protein
MSEVIWYDNINAFFEREKLMNFFPSDDMSYEEKLNSSFRFCIYLSILLFLVKRTHQSLYIVFFAGVVTYILYNNKSSRAIEETFNGEVMHTSDKCTQPSKINPFMNVLVTDYVNNPKKPRACNVSDKNIKDKMEKYFYKDLYRNIDDIFNKKSSFRQFYTTPSTSIPNDQESFAKWLYYNEDKTCKEGNTSRCFG